MSLITSIYSIPENKSWATCIINGLPLGPQPQSLMMTSGMTMGCQHYTVPQKPYLQAQGRPPSSLWTFLPGCLLFCRYKETFLLHCNVAVNSKSVALCQTLSSKCVVTRFPDSCVSIPLSMFLGLNSSFIVMSAMPWILESKVEQTALGKKN